MKEKRTDCEKSLLMEDTAPEKIRHLQKCSSCRNVVIFAEGSNIALCEHCGVPNERPKSRDSELALLKYANERHIRVIPEIDMPGHMRAAKKAMGNLLTQAMALGDIADLDQLRQVVRNSENVESWTPNHTPQWEEAYQKLLTFLK